MTKDKEYTLETVCDELDRLSISMLDVIKEYIDCKVIIENYIKTGCLHLAKARYIMGNKSVSSLQLPTEDCDVLARTKVSQMKQKSGSMDSLTFEIQRLSLDESPEKKVSDLRERKHSKGSPQEKKSNAEILKDDASRKGDGISQDTRPLNISKDPLKWFGVLIPQNMKFAQHNFSTSLDYVVQCVNLQLEMNSIHTKYRELMEIKRTLIKNSE